MMKKGYHPKISPNPDDFYISIFLVTAMASPSRRLPTRQPASPKAQERKRSPVRAMSNRCAGQ